MIDTECLGTIRKTVRRFLSVDQATVDDITSQVWLHCFEHGYLPNTRIIHGFCMNHLRLVMFERLPAVRRAISAARTCSSDEDIVEQVNDLLEQAPLERLEREILWRRFWNNERVRDLAKHIGLPRHVVLSLIQQAKQKLLATAKERS